MAKNRHGERGSNKCERVEKTRKGARNFMDKMGRNTVRNTVRGTREWTRKSLGQREKERQRPLEIRLKIIEVNKKEKANYNGA